MPIKFRCQHCRQFLGISRAQAGGIVDCPTCGRTIRVPELDGSLVPLPKPKLDPKDSKLTAALNELASIGESNGFDESPANAERETSIPKPDSTGRRPSPRLRSFVVLGPEGQPVDFDALPEPSSIAPVDPTAPPVGAHIGTLDEIPPIQPESEPASGEPVPVDPPSAPLLPPSKVESAPSDDDDGRKRPRPWAETAQPNDSWKKLLAAAGNQPEEEAALTGRSADEEQSPPDGSAEPHVKSSSDQTSSLRSMSTGMWFALLGCAAVLFAGGFWVGRMTTLTGEDNLGREESKPESQSIEGTVGPKANSVRPDSSDQKPDMKPALRGRITFLADGVRKPDRGARVIVLPKERSGVLKLSVAGFRAGDSPEDQRIAEAALTAMGGALASASDDGEFEISLRSSGQFYVLVLSNSLVRDEEALDVDVESAVGLYFDRPTQLVGRVRCYIEEVRWGGESAEPWDHSFRG